MTTKKTVEEMVEGLAIAVSKGFDGVNEEIVALKDEFRGEMKEVKNRLSNVERELAGVKFQALNLDPRITILERKVDLIGAKLGLQS